MTASDLLICCRCGCIVSNVYRAPAATRCTENDPRMWETHNGPSRQVCGACIGRALDSASAAVRAYVATPAGKAQLERELEEALCEQEELEEGGDLEERLDAGFRVADLQEKLNRAKAVKP